MKEKKLFHIRKIVIPISACFGIWLAVRFSAECSRGILSGILFCVQALVPSLFVFMAASAFAVKSGAALTLSKPLGKVSKALFGLPYPALSAILLSIIGGYPVGARSAAIMYEEGCLSERQAQKAVYIAVCAGPGFLLSFVGRALLGSPDAGLILLTAEILSVLLTGMIIGRAVRCDMGFKPPSKHRPVGNLLISSVTDASSATFKMCSMVMICSALIEIIKTVSPDKTVSDISAALIEITTGCGMLGGRYPLAVVAFFIGFGGISVHLQIYASVGDLHIGKGLFFLFRIIQGIICSALTYILLMIFPMEISVFNSADVSLTAAKSATLIGSTALVICSLLFLGTANKLMPTRSDR